ncbi:hypothetical protein HK405_003687 [Cladochytrium tenue]|nr:hypothetical protein HK405_003687 [Cladochytrium tenue]
MSEWNRRAAAAVVRRNQLTLGTAAATVADLHGLTRREALQAIDDALNVWDWRNRHPEEVAQLAAAEGGSRPSGSGPRGAPPTPPQPPSSSVASAKAAAAAAAAAAVRQPLRVITGAGNHSSKNRAVLFPAVLAHVQRRGWRTRVESDGSFLVLWN